MFGQTFDWYLFTFWNDKKGTFVILFGHCFFSLWLSTFHSSSPSLFICHTHTHTFGTFSAHSHFHNCANICRFTTLPITLLFWNLSICQVLDATDVRCQLKLHLLRLYLIMVIWLLLVSFYSIRKHKKRENLFNRTNKAREIFQMKRPLNLITPHWGFPMCARYILFKFKYSYIGCVWYIFQCYHNKGLK